MTEGEKKPLSCETDNCYRPGSILGVTVQGVLRLCGEHFLQKIDLGELNGTVSRHHTICMHCPATLCTDFGNGYMSMVDFQADTADYQPGSISECPILRRSVHNPQEDMYVDDDGTEYFQTRSVRDLENGL